jgi:hypothetical protein
MPKHVGLARMVTLALRRPPLVEAAAARTPPDRWVMAQLMTLRALQGRHAEAQALVQLGTRVSPRPRAG